MGNQAAKESPAIDAGADTTKQKKSGVCGQSSSFGTTDPIETFKNTIKEQCEEGTLPPFRKTKIYQIYEWSKGSFDHKSIVVGCNDSGNDYGFITMELFVDIAKEKIFPFCKFIDQKEGIIKMKERKWRLVLSKLETKLSNLVDLSLDLINAHGTYSIGYNNCQTFVNAFKAACGKPNEKISTKQVAAYSTMDNIKDSFVRAHILPTGGVATVLIFAAGVVDYTVRPLATALNDNKYGGVSLEDSQNITCISTSVFESFLKSRQRYNNANGKYNNEISDWLNEMKTNFNENNKTNHENSENSTIKHIKFIAYTAEKLNNNENENENENGNSSFRSIAKWYYGQNIDFVNGLYWIQVNSDDSIWIICRKYDELAKISLFLQDKLKIEIKECALPLNISSMNKAPLRIMTRHFQELLFAALKDKGAPYCLLANFVTKNKISQADMKDCIEKSQQDSDTQ